jgi:hypothetical protein
MSSEKYNYHDHVILFQGTSEEWRIIFYIASGVAVFAAVMYGIFGNSELAPWARGTENDIEIEVEPSKEALTNGLDVQK